LKDPPLSHSLAPPARESADYRLQDAITAGIYDRRNGVRSSFFSARPELKSCRPAASRRPGLSRKTSVIRGHTTLQEVRRIGNKGGGSAIMFAGTRNGAFRCHNTFSRSTDRAGSRMILRVRTCRM